MIAGVVLFEGAEVAALSPLADLVPVMGLRFGATTLGERLVRAAGAPLLALEGRLGPLAAWRERPPLPHATGPDREVLALDAATLPGPWLAAARAEQGERLFTCAGRVAGARLALGRLAAGSGRGPEFAPFLGSLGLPEQAVPATMLRWPWELMHWNAAAVTADLDGARGEILGDVHPQAAIYAGERVTVARSARVDAFAVLDARHGPIALGDAVVVQPHTVVVGPCVVGAGTQLLGGVISRSTIGPECRLAGEIEECVWQGWANKRHHGFVGHSVVGSWVNLGALTTTSDLKNNYGSVRVWAGGALRDSGSPKVGALIGDHVKTGIGTLLPTGASIGTGANLFGGGRFAPRRLEPFTWWDGEHGIEHRFDPFLATARTAMSRRGIELSPEERAVLETAFLTSAHARH